MVLSPPADRAVLKGPHEPTWNCKECGKKGIWASRCKCWCGCHAPQHVIRKALKEDAKAQKLQDEKNERGTNAGAGNKKARPSTEAKLQKRVEELEALLTKKNDTQSESPSSMETESDHSDEPTFAGQKAYVADLEKRLAAEDPKSPIGKKTIELYNQELATARQTLETLKTPQQRAHAAATAWTKAEKARDAAAKTLQEQRKQAAEAQTKLAEAETAHDKAEEAFAKAKAEYEQTKHQAQAQTGIYTPTTEDMDAITAGLTAIKAEGKLAWHTNHLFLEALENGAGSQEHCSRDQTTRGAHATGREHSRELSSEL